MPFTISLQITDIVRLRVNNTESFNLQCEASNDILAEEQLWFK